MINEQEARVLPVGRGREHCDLCGERTETAECERMEIAKERSELAAYFRHPPIVKFTWPIPL